MTVLTLCLALGLASPDADAPAPRQWYGWQTLAVDGSAFVVQDVLTEATMVTYVAGPQIVHLVHGRPGAALASLAARVVVPIFIAPRFADCPRYSAGDSASPFGVGGWACTRELRNAVWISWSVVALFDALVLGWD